MKRMFEVFGIALVVVFFALVSGSCDSVSDSVVQFDTTNEEVEAIDGLNTVVSIQNVFREIAESVGPGVVSIYVEGTYEASDYSYSPYYWFFGDDYYGGGAGGEQVWTASGSGFIFTEDGYIFSNNHVVEDAERISVVLSDGSEYEATLVGVDPYTDVAVLKIEDDEDFEVCSMGDSDEVLVGDWVLAIGNPYELAGSYTFGVVSALEREGMEQYQSFIQTDAAVNPGNSGGPLVNIYGQVIGINTAIQTESGGFQGISFAVPINIAKNVAIQLIETGEVDRGHLGVSLSELDDATREALDIEGGVMVSYVDGGSPAEDAGIERGDIILTYNGEEIDTANEIVILVGNDIPGNTVTLGILRGDEELSVEVTLGSKNHPGGTSSSSSDTDKDEDFSESSYDFLGATFIPATDDVLSESGESSGVMVYDVDRDSLLNGVLSYGDLVIGINRTPIEDLSDLEKFDRNNSDTRAFTFQVISDGYLYYRGVQVK